MPPRAYAPWGCIVRVVSLTKSRKLPTRKILPLFFASRLPAAVQVRYASWAVQFHPDGGQLGLVWLPARATRPHGGVALSTCGEPDETKGNAHPIIPDYP